MSLNAPPARGFADWQRTGPWDSGILYSGYARNDPSGLTTPFLDVSRWAYLMGSDLVNAACVVVTLVWYSEPGGLHSIGGMQFTLSNLVGIEPQYRIPNMGPFVQVTWTIPGGGNFGHTVTLMGTNRFHPLEFLPFNPVLIDVLGAAIPANSSVPVYPGDYYAGPVQVYFNGALNAMSYQPEYLTSGNVWSFMDFYPLSAGAVDSRIIVMPPGAWRITVNNSGGVSTFNVKATPTVTGST